MFKIDLRFRDLADTEFAANAEMIVSSLSRQRNLVVPTKSVLSAALRDFTKALALPKKTPTSEARIAATRSILEMLLEKLATNLKLGAVGTEAQPPTGRFGTERNGACNRVPVDAPTNVRLKPTGTSGEVQVLSASVRRARAYQVQFARHEDTSQWFDGGTFASTRGMIVQNLTRAKDYWFRIRAIGPGGPGNWSDAVTILVS